MLAVFAERFVPANGADFAQTKQGEPGNLQAEGFCLFVNRFLLFVQVRFGIPFLNGGELLDDPGGGPQIGGVLGCSQGKCFLSEQSDGGGFESGVLLFVRDGTSLFLDAFAVGEILFELSYS
jgi:hypothetical protein